MLWIFIIISDRKVNVIGAFGTAKMKISKVYWKVKLFIALRFLLITCGINTIYFIVVRRILNYGLVVHEVQKVDDR